jgi:hypothetical protein
MVLGDLYEAASEFQKLQKHKKPLDPDERKQCLDAKAVWHFSHQKSPTPAVWKSVHPKTGKSTFITNTHRAYNTAPTLKGAIGRFHKFIKSTA